MIKDITIGQYFPGNSLLHRLDPRMKLTLTVLFMVLVFLPKGWISMGLVVLFLGGIILLSRLPVKLLWKSVKPILFIVLFTAVLNIFYVREGRILWQAGFIQITAGGLNTAAFMAVRIICLIAGSSLLTYTTTPTALTDGMECLLRPLNYVHINVHELAMMMTIALRFIPTLMEEADKIMSAQKARGADMESGSLIQRIRALVPILIPLFVSSFRRAYDLAMAMECRCYHGGKGRTRMKQLHTGTRDWIALAVCLLLLVALLLANRFFGGVTV